MEINELLGGYGNIPLNRQERFYTATVLPAIICSDQLHRFLRLLGRDDVPCNLTPGHANTVIYTEYDLRDAIRGFDDLRGETPDLVVLYRPAPLLIVLEAKLFGAVSAAGIKEQILGQRRSIVDPLRTILGSCEVIQVALVPDDLAGDLSELTGKESPFQVITWRKIACEYANVAGPEYWVGVLCYALQREKDLRAKNGLRGDHGDARMRAAEILDAYSKPNCVIRYVGAGRGRWLMLKLDVKATGGTKMQLAVSYASDAPSYNYICVAEFVGAVRAWMSCL